MGTGIEQRALQEEAAILEWRYTTLRRAGYTDDEAFLLATNDEIDLHLACDLRSRGCPAETAVRILV